MFPRVTAGIFGAIVAASASCANGALPAGAQISCESDDGCPPATRCSEVLQRCVGNDDLVAPKLRSDPLPTPTQGGVDTSFHLAFAANEPLGAVPIVVASVGRLALPPFALVSASEDGRDYEFEYTAAGDEPEGVATVEIEFVDESGNVATASAGVFTLDFTPPALAADISLNVEIAGAGTLVEARVAFDEPLAGEPEVTLVQLDETSIFFAPLSMTPAGADTFTYLPTGIEAGGIFSVRVEAVDLAGNVAEVESTATVKLDFTPPFALDSGPDKPEYDEGELIFFTLVLSEPVLQDIVETSEESYFRPRVIAQLRSGAPGLDVIPLEPVVIAAPDRIFLSHRVRDCDEPGAYDVTVSEAVDLAGNRAAPMAQNDWSFTINDRVECPE